MKNKKLIKSIVTVFIITVTILVSSITASAAGQTTVTLEKGKELEYATGYGWSTSRLTADGELTYCIMPDKPVPPDGKYSTSDNNLKKLTSSNTENYTWFTKALYYGYGGDGFNTKLSAFTTNSNNHQVVNKDGTCKAFMDNLKYSQYGFEMLEPNGSDLYYLLTHRVLAYINGYSKWNYNLPSTDWESAIIELANAIKKAPTVPVTTELYVMDLGSKYQQVILQKDVIQLQLQKTSADTEITNGNSCYSLEGAEYSIYLDKACTEYFGKMTTDEKGFAMYGKNVPYQNYYIKETKAPKGYALDETVYSFKSATAEEKNGITIYTYKVKDIPQTDPIGLLLNKIDSETGESSERLSNAEFTIKYYDDYYDTIEHIEDKISKRE